MLETDRILNPQFDDAVLYFTGAQIEMLRNMTQYLNRIDTYASLYNLTSYLVPTDDDFDDILAIVADMEETLMGNPNTIWGYEDRLAEREDHTKVGAGTYNMDFDQVPAGEVWVVTAIASYNSASNGYHEYLLSDSVTYYPVYPFGYASANIWRVTAPMHLVLKEDDRMRIVFRDCQNNDILIGTLTGYKMDFPV